jgi:uncharacterized membrane protein YfcA
MNYITATTYSLLIVGTTSLIGIFFNKEKANLKQTMIFAIPSIVTMFIFRYYITKNLPEKIYNIDTNNILNTTLSILIIYLGYVLFLSKTNIKTKTKKSISYSNIVFTSILTSIVMGLMGVGGGFIIVPSLILFLDFDAKKAKSASLIIIALNAFIGSSVDVVFRNFALDIKFLLYSTLLSVLGIALGIFSSSFLNSKSTTKFFGLFMLLLGPILILKSIFQ